MSKTKRKRKKNPELLMLANALVEKLKSHKIIVQRYDSYGTNSIYLKLDFGVCNSIRISDHKGKKHLSYRYNVLSICPYPVSSKDDRGFIRYYFPLSEQDLLIKKVIFDRNSKLNMYGLRNYQMYMAMNKNQGESRKGFWQQAKIV